MPLLGKKSIVAVSVFFPLLLPLLCFFLSFHSFLLFFFLGWGGVGSNKSLINLPLQLKILIEQNV